MLSLCTCSGTFEAAKEKKGLFNGYSAKDLDNAYTVSMFLKYILSTSEG